jgi:hypothetical protein
MSHRSIKSVWRSVLLSVFTSFIILLSSGCSAADKETNRNTNQGGQVNADIPSGGDLIEIDSYEFVEEGLTTDIKTISPRIGLAPLPKTARPEEFEFRIWTNLGGLGDAKVLSVRSTENENHADFFDINRALDPLRFRRASPANPRSGWNKMLFEVRSRLTTPKGLVRDPQFELSRDEPLILLEVLDKGEYRRVLYGQNTLFQDGKRLIEVCDYLAYEFGVDMNCRGVRTR